MKIIIEGHKYLAASVKGILHGIDALENVEGYVILNYVGYFIIPNCMTAYLSCPKSFWKR